MPTPTTSTAAPAAFGTVGWLVLAAVPLWWSRDESGGNRWFLVGLALLALGFAVARAIATVRAMSGSARD